ncbi:hypothetical protein SK128_022449 [Halocaridina rubra]|uniref:Transmembrane protein n=1 Tax=Halocaridina rubra TaxID=373956 RepID=A0AAN8XNW7_HALRR
MSGTQESAGLSGTQESVGMSGTQESLGMSGTQESAGLSGTQESLGMSGTQESVGMSGTQEFTMNAVEIYHQWAPALLGAEDPSATSRQFSQVINFLNGIVTNVPFDLPTVMALLLVFFFIVQFYWTLITMTLNEITSSSSSSSATTTTTTTTTSTPAPKIALSAFQALEVTPRTQTVTPAPAPEWRHLLRDFDLPHWVKKRSADVHSSGIQYRQNHNNDYTTEPVGTLGGTWGTRGRHPGQRLTYIEAERMWDMKPLMDLQYGAGEGRGGRWFGDDTLDLSSHRLVNLPSSSLNGETSEVASNMLYAAERWGDRLQQWHVISPEGGQLITQTLMMMRCAIGGVDFCAKLDHHFRRQHDLNLAAAMMNYHEEDYSTENDVDEDKRHDYSKYEFEEQWHPGLPDRAWPAADQVPGRVFVAVSPASTPSKVKIIAQRRHNRLPTSGETAEEPESEDIEKNGASSANKKISKGGDVDKTSWNIYIFMSVMAVLVFLMDASYRILRVVSATTGRALQDPHQDVLTALTAAVRRWETINSPLHT